MVVLSAVSLDCAARTVQVGADGVARFADEPEMSRYSSPSIIAWRRMRLASAEMSSKPCPANWDNQDNCSVRPRNLYGMFKVTNCSDAAGGRFSGQFENVPPVVTSSGMETSETPWPPVCEPVMPTASRSIRDAPWPGGRANLFLYTVYTG